MRQQLGHDRRRGYRLVLEPGTYERGDQHAEAERRQVGHREPPVALEHARQRPVDAQQAIWRQAARGQKTGQHQEHLHRQAAVLCQPLEQPRRERRRTRRQGAVAREVMSDDHGASQALHRIEQRHPRGGGRGVRAQDGAALRRIRA
jgi:hypothetical protein